MSGTSQQVPAAPAAPAGGMRRIPIPLESYQHPSPPLSGKLLLNFYAEQEPDDARTAAALISTPGLEAYLNLAFPPGPVLAINTEMPDLIYAVSGTHLFRAYFPVHGSSFVIQDLGDIGAPAGGDWEYNLMPTIAVGTTAAVVCIPPNAFTCSHDYTVAPSSALNQIGGDFPGATSVSYCDGYFVFTSNNFDTQFFCSLLLDPSSFDALDFAYADGVPNVLKRVINVNNDLWLFGNSGVEIWYDAGSSGLETTPGTSFFPFRRRAVGVIPFGTVVIRSIVIADSSVFWLADQGIVMRSSNYQAKRISTHAIEDRLQVIGTTTAITALAYTQDGHTFYCLTYPGVTFVYDCATRVWHERKSGLSEWLPMSAGRYGDVFLLGSSVDGRVFLPVPKLGTEDGVAQQRTVILPPIWASTYRAFCHRLEVEMEVGNVGNPASVQLDWSDDGGYTWTVPRALQADTSGNHRKRVYTTRLGSFRQRVFRLTVAGHATIYAVDAHIDGGNAG